MELSGDNNFWSPQPKGPEILFAINLDCGWYILMCLSVKVRNWSNKLQIYFSSFRVTRFLYSTLCCWYSFATSSSTKWSCLLFSCRTVENKSCYPLELFIVYFIANARLTLLSFWSASGTLFWSHSDNIVPRGKQFKRCLVANIYVIAEVSQRNEEKERERDRDHPLAKKLLLH